MGSELARRLPGLLLLAALGLLLAQPVSAGEVPPGAAGLAQAEDGGGSLEPRYAPREPEEKSWYNSDYLFGMTRGVSGSTIHPAGKVPLFLLTVPLDLVLLPFAAIGGLFG